MKHYIEYRSKEGRFIGTKYFFDNFEECKSKRDELNTVKSLEFGRYLAC